MVACTVLSGCTKEKTDYQADTGSNIPEHQVFKTALSFEIDGFNIEVQALNGTFYTGYNALRFIVIPTANTTETFPVAVNFIPVLNQNGTLSSCPHAYNFESNTEENYYMGYAVFTQPSKDWNLYFKYTIGSKTYTHQERVAVQEQNNKNLHMTSFVGNDNVSYYIALIAPQRPQVSENTLIAGIYRYDVPAAPSATIEGSFPDPQQYAYSQVKGYRLQLDPRMPEPSMGNHSSPNNRDLTQQQNGFYEGTVNYTMTGNWTLNFIMLNQNGRIIKGTTVPKDFTPGVAGKKSELFIDVLL